MAGVDYHLVIKLFTIVSLATSVQTLPSAVQWIYADRDVYKSQPALYIYWSTISGSGITYTVCYSTSSGTQCGPPTSASCSTGITGTSTTLRYLYSGYSYYIWVAAVSSGEQGPYSDRYQIRTYSVPGLVNLSVTPFTDENGLNVTWSRPSGDYLYSVTYRVSFRRLKFGYWNSTYSTSKRQYNIYGLAPGTSYVVWVQAVSPIGSGPSASSYATIYQLPGSVFSLSASPYRSSISITWGPPSGSNYPTPVTYRLRYRERPSSGPPGGWSSTVQRTATQTQYTTSVLKPGTRYEVEVWAVSSLGDGPNVTTTATTYQLPGQITSLQVRPSTSIFGLIITWGPPSGINYPTPVTYRLRYRERPSSGPPGGWSSTVQRTATRRQYTTPVLKPGTRYEVEIWTVSSVGNGQGILGTASTLQLPGSVTSLQVRPSTTIFGLIITWGPPSDSNHPTVTYRLRYRERPYNGPLYGWSSTIYRSTSQREYTTPVLTPGTRYEIEVWPVSSSSAGPTRQVYGITASGAIGGLTVSPHATQRLLTVMWQPPTDITNPNHYKLRYRNTPSGSWSSERTIYVPQTQYNITGLEATTTYEVEVWATLGSSEGSRSRQTATVQGVPDVQLRVDSREADSITVIPSGPSGAVSYKEYGSSSNFTNEPYFNRIVILQLKPNTQYVISYAAKNRHGTGTTEITTFTLAEAPSGLKLVVHSSTAINATWRAPANSQSLTYYIKYSSPLTGQNTRSTRATALALTGLHPHEQYNISVQARNRAGLSLPVYATVKTYSDTPSGTIHKILSTTGTDWINLVWVPPSSYDRNGIIIKYIIGLLARDDDIVVDVENPAFNIPNNVNYNITGLSPGTRYSLRVAAATVNGTGPYSSWRRIKTVETAPGPVQNLTFESTSLSSVRITWEEPAVPNGVIQSYKVMYGDINDSSTLSTTTYAKYATLYRLVKETPYIVSVRARTSAGYGENESIVVFSKQGAPSKAVEEVTVEWTSDTSVLVSWTPLSYSEAKGLPLYIVTYKPQDGSSVGIVNTTSSSIVITGLNPLIGYIFTVQVTTGNGNNKGDPLSEFVAARLQHTDIKGALGLFFGGLGAGLLIELLLLGTVCGLYKRRQYRKSKAAAADTTLKSTPKCTESDPNNPKIDEEGVYENLPEIRYMSSAPATGRPGVRIM